MAVVIQTGNSVESNLLNLINTSNGIGGTPERIQSGQVTFGTPTVRTPDADPSNTSLELTPVADHGFNGDPVTITYVRPRVSHASASPTLSWTIPTNLSSFLSTFLTIAAGNLSVMVEEIELDASTPLSSVLNDGVPVDLIINAKAGSLLYTGTQTVSITWPVEQVDLGSRITVTKQDGFDEAGA